MKVKKFNQTSYKVNSRFLETTCGNGNFLIEILARKLQVVNEVDKSRQDFINYT